MKHLLLKNLDHELWAALHREAFDAGLGMRAYCIAVLVHREKLPASALGIHNGSNGAAPKVAPRKRRTSSVVMSVDEAPAAVEPGPSTIVGNWDALKEAAAPKTPGAIGKKCPHDYMNWLLCPACNPK